MAPVSRFIYACIEKVLAMAIGKGYIAPIILLAYQFKAKHRHQVCYNAAQELSQIRLNLMFGVHKYKTSTMSR